MDIQAIADQLEIERVINLYGKGAAARDVDLLVGLFTADAVLEYEHLDVIVAGSDAIRHMFSDAYFPPRESPPRLGLDELLVSTPMMTNVVVDVDGDTAAVESYCLAVHGGVRGSDELVVCRGTRNVDVFRRTAEGWKINRRRHEMLWGMETPSTVPARGHERGDQG